MFGCINTGAGFLERLGNVRIVKTPKWTNHSGIWAGSVTGVNSLRLWVLFWVQGDKKDFQRSPGAQGFWDPSEH